MPKSRRRPRAAAKATAARRAAQGQSDAALAYGWPPAGSGTWLTGDISEEEAAWLAGAAAVRQRDTDDKYVFSEAPWAVWLEARAAGAPMDTLAKLGHEPFWYIWRDGDEVITDAVTIAVLIAGAMPETVVRTDRDTTIAQSVEDLAAEGVLRWDQASQTATQGPRTIRAAIAEDNEHMRRFGHY